MGDRSDLNLYVAKWIFRRRPFSSKPRSPPGLTPNGSVRVLEPLSARAQAPRLASWLSMEPVDHYGYWHAQALPRRVSSTGREVHLRLIEPHLRPGGSVLDAGCGAGRFLELLNGRDRDLALVGADFSPLPLETARRKGGSRSHRANFEVAMPFADDIRHRQRRPGHGAHLQPRSLCRELRRVLRDDGHLVLSTPNLCAWFNRLLVPVGVQPIFYESSTESSLVGGGSPATLQARDASRGSRAPVHAARALRPARTRGFSIVETRGAVFDEGLPPRLLPFDRAFALKPSLAALLVVLARRTGLPAQPVG